MTMQTLTTEQVATLLHIRAQTLRAALSTKGHYFGIRPIKAPNRFLLWRVADVERLVKGEVPQC